MRKFIKFIICVGLILVLAGGAIVGYAAVKGHYKGNVLEAKSFTTEETFDNITLKMAMTDVEFRESSDDKVTVNYNVLKGYTYSFSTDNGTFTIVEKEDSRWYERIFRFYLEDSKMVVSLPKNSYNELTITNSTSDLTISNFDLKKIDIKGSTGDVKISKSNIETTCNLNMSTGSVYLTDVNVSSDLKINVSTGDVILNNVNSGSLNIGTSTGDVKLANTVVNSELTVKTTTGDIRFKSSDAKTIKANTSIGSIKGSILTSKSFKTKTTTGDVDVPNTVGDECNLETTTGDIKITIEQ